MTEPSKILRDWPVWGRCLAFGACLLPPVLLLVLLQKNAVNVPFWDEWQDDIAGIFVKYSDGHLAFADLWAQHNESRFVLPRLIFLALGGLTHWNLIYEMAFTFLLACLAAGAVFRLGGKTFAGRPAARWAVFFIASLLIFSPTQYEAWLWGMELILYVPLVCILASLLLLQTALSERMKIILCAGLAVVGTYSFSNGLLVWIVLFPVLFLSDGWAGLRKKSRAALGWALGLVANATVYFQDYQSPQPSGIWHLLWTNPWQVVEYLLAFLGGPLVVVDYTDGSGVFIAVVIGGVLLMLFVLTAVLLFRWRNNSVLARESWPWLTLGGYGLLSGLLATIGRVSLGPEQAMSSRYAIFGTCLIVALVHLVSLLVFHQPVTRNSAIRKPVTSIPLLVMLGATVILVHARSLPFAVHNMTLSGLKQLHAKSCLKFINILPPQPAAPATLFPDMIWVKIMANALDQRGWFNYPLLRTNRVAAFQMNPPPSQPVGIIENYQFIGTNQLFMRGWAISATHHAAADCVLFSCESTGVAPAFFGLMDQRLFRPDLVQKIQDRAYLFAGWEKTVPLADLPKGALLIKVWVYDVEDDSITPLANDVRLKNK